MSINTDFYGTENSWIQLSRDTPDLFKTAYPYNNDTSYQGSLKAFQESSITNPDNVASPVLDDSIIPWKVNEKSDVFNHKYIYPYCIDYTNPQQSTWMYQSSDYTQNVNGGFRFFIQDAPLTNVNTGGPNGVWVLRYSPLNTKGQLDESAYRRLFPIVGFDYSKCYVQIYLLYVAKSAFDDITTSWTATGVSKMYIKDLIDDNSKWENNYFYGIQYELRYKGLSGNAHSLGMFAYDKIKASPYSGGYYPYGEGFNHYQTAMTDVYDTGQMGRAQIGGIVGGTGNAFTIRWDSTTHTDIIELFKKNYDETHCLRHMGGLKDGENIVFNRQSSANNVRLIPFRTYDSDSKQDFIEYARKQAAYLGFPFSDSTYNMIDNPDKTYIPEINSSGVTTGNYALADTQPDYINAEWTIDVYNKTPYNPKNDKADDTNTYDNNTTILNTDAVIPSYFTTPYVMNATKVIATAEKFYDKIDTDFTSDLWSAKTLYTNNPIDAVISLMYFPFHLEFTSRPQLIYTQQRHLVFGAVDLESVAEAVLSSSCVLDFGKCTYFPNFGVDDFRNYEPYCKGELYIPYCGSVAINPSEFLNRTISVKMIVDLRNGSCLALVFRDNLVVETASGQIGITIPISGLQSQTLASAEIQAKTAYQNSKSRQLSNIAKTAIDLVGNSMTGNVFGMLNSMANQSQIAIGENNLYKSKFELEHIQIPFSVKGSASSATALVNEQRCRFILYRPIMLENNLTTFAHQNGYATLEHNTLNNYTGFTMCDTADLSGINCTKSEKNLIMNYLKNGVYL